MAKTHKWTQIIWTNSWKLNVSHWVSSSHWSPTYPSNCQIIGGVDPVDPDLVGQDPKQVESFKNSSSNNPKLQGMSFKHKVLSRHATPYFDDLICHAKKQLYNDKEVGCWHANIGGWSNWKIWQLHYLLV